MLLRITQRFICILNNIILFCSTRSKWLFEESTAIFPSLYFKYEDMDSEKRAKFMRGRMTESTRVANMGDSRRSVYPYTWLKYYDTKQFVDKVIIIFRANHNKTDS